MSPWQQAPDSHFALAPLAPQDCLRLDDSIVWCGSMVQSEDERCHLFLSLWPREHGFSAWVTHSRIGYAVAASADERFHYQGLTFCGSGEAGAWDRDVIHNPNVLYENGLFYLYYNGNYGNGEYWDHRNHQRIGVAIASDPRGPWRRFAQPLLDVSADGWDCALTTNPSVTRMADGRYIMVYKGVGKEGPAPMLGPVLHGVAFADSPTGPFHKAPEPIFRAGELNFPGEDPYVFSAHGKLFCILKDMDTAYYAKASRSLVLFQSDNGIDWTLAAKPLVMTRHLRWQDGMTQEVARLERPQLFCKNGQPHSLFVAIKPEKESDDAYNARIRISFDQSAKAEEA
jgi:hypothetical protein